MIMYWAPDQLTSRPLSNLQVPCNMSVDNKGSLQMVFCRPRMVSKKPKYKIFKLGIFANTFTFYVDDVMMIR